jgi:hypothetical protein
MIDLTSLASPLRGLSAFGLMLVVSSCAPESCACNTELIQVILQPNSPETVETSEDLLHKISRKIKGKHLEISLLKGDRVNLHHSQATTRLDISDIADSLDPNPETPEFEIIPSSDEALVPAIQRFSDRVHDLKASENLTSFIVTSGTSDPNIILKLRYLLQKVAKSPNAIRSRLYVIGLTPDNRLPLSDAVHPIADFVEFSSDNSKEWKKIVQRLK